MNTFLIDSYTTPYECTFRRSERPPPPGERTLRHQQPAAGGSAAAATTKCCFTPIVVKAHMCITHSPTHGLHPLHPPLHHIWANTSSPCRKLKTSEQQVQTAPEEGARGVHDSRFGRQTNMGSARWLTQTFSHKYSVTTSQRVHAELESFVSKKVLSLFNASYYIMGGMGWGGGFRRLMGAEGKYSLLLLEPFGCEVWSCELEPRAHFWWVHRRNVPLGRGVNLWGFFCQSMTHQCLNPTLTIHNSDQKDKDWRNHIIRNIFGQNTEVFIWTVPS